MSWSRPARGNKEVGQGIEDSGAPARGGVDDGGGHGQVLGVATAVTAHKGDDGVGEGEVEDGGEGEGDEEALEGLFSMAWHGREVEGSP